MTNLMKAFRFWRQKGYNPFEAEDDNSWEYNADGNLSNRNSINDMKSICTNYGVTIEALNIIISEHNSRDIGRNFQGMGGCVYKKNDLKKLLEGK